MPQDPRGLCDQHSPATENKKKNLLYPKVRDGNPPTRSTRQIKAQECMSQKKHNNQDTTNKLKRCCLPQIGQ
jgi:hypothetical protein